MYERGTSLEFCLCSSFPRVSGRHVRYVISHSDIRCFPVPFKGAHRVFVLSGWCCPSMCVGDSHAFSLLGARDWSCVQALQLLVLLREDFRSPHIRLQYSFLSLLPLWHQDKTFLCLLRVCESTSCFIATFFAFLVSFFYPLLWIYNKPKERKQKRLW